MNRKGQTVFYWAVLLIIMIVLARMTIMVLSGSNDVKTKLGKPALDVLGAYQEGNKHSFSVREAGLRSMTYAIFELGENGGFESDSKCGKYLDYALWTDGEKECYPDNLQNVLSSKMDDRLSGYLTAYSDNLKGTSFDYFVEGSTLKAIANWDINVPLYKGHAGREVFADFLLDDTSSSSSGEVVGEASGYLLDDYVGKYLLNPSFSLDMGFGLAEFGKLEELSRTLIGECSGEADREGCIKNILLEYDGDLDVTLGDCELENRETGFEKIAVEFFDRFEKCLDLEDKQCVCEISMDVEGAEGDYEMKFDEDGTASFQKESKGVARKLKQPLVKAGENPFEPDEYSHIDYHASYLDGKASDGKLTLPGWISNTEWNDYNSLLLYKDIDGSLILTKEWSALRRCADPNNKFKFCATPEKKFLYMKGAKAKFIKPQIKFALSLIDKPPAPVKEVKIEPREAADGLVLVSWKKSPEKDVIGYKIYYSLNDFIDIPVESLEENGVKVTEVLVEKAIKLKSIDFSLPQCTEFSDTSKTCKFRFMAVDLSDAKTLVDLNPGDVYYLEQDDRYVFVLGGLSDGAAYNFAVTAVDIGSNEMDNVETKFETGENYVSARAEDKLAPGILSVYAGIPRGQKDVLRIFWSSVNNIDGTPNDDPTTYKFYWALGPFTLAESLSPKPDGEPYEITELEEDINIDDAGFVRGKDYYIAVVAFDDNENAYLAKVYPKKVSIPTK